MLTNKNETLMNPERLWVVSAPLVLRHVFAAVKAVPAAGLTTGSLAWLTSSSSRVIGQYLMGSPGWLSKPLNGLNEIR